MNTFLPYADFEKSAKVLDKKRRNKQIVETGQIINILKKKEENIPVNGFANHPAVLMWEGYLPALAFYNVIFMDSYYKETENYQNYNKEWLQSMFLLKNIDDEHQITLPYWFGDLDFHRSHQSNLLRKDFDFYSKVFTKIPNDLDYVWPTYYKYWDKPHRQLTDQGMKSLLKTRKRKEK